MKVRDLILEARIYQNNFIKVDMVEEELKKIFEQSDHIPTVNFDEDGMFITMDNFTLREYENFGGLNKFTLTDAGLVDEIKNIRKYYIEYSQPEEPINKKEDKENPGKSNSEET